MWFEDDLAAQLTVSRNHAASYRNETWVYGEEGVCHGGLFQEDSSMVEVETYNREGVIEKEVFSMGRPEKDVPEFMLRFGPAYKAEVADFIERCLADEPFSVTHRDGLKAMEVVSIGSQSLMARQEALPVDYAARQS